MEVVHRVFRKRSWNYRDYTHQKGVKAFELGIRENGKLLHVKVTFPERRGEFTVVEDHVTLKADAVVKVRGEYRTVCRLPELMPMESRIENGYTVVTLPEITGYDMFVFR